MMHLGNADMENSIRDGYRISWCIIVVGVIL